jgi:hypothetical protein
MSHLRRFLHCGVTALEATAVAGEIDASADLASADEATRPSEASDNVSANSFFIVFSPENGLGRTHLRAPQGCPAGELDLLIKTPIKSGRLQLNAHGVASLEGDALVRQAHDNSKRHRQS